MQAAANMRASTWANTTNGASGTCTRESRVCAPLSTLVVFVLIPAIAASLQHGLHASLGHQQELGLPGINPDHAIKPRKRIAEAFYAGAVEVCECLEAALKENGLLASLKVHVHVLEPGEFNLQVVGRCKAQVADACIEKVTPCAVLEQVVFHSASRRVLKDAHAAGVVARLRRELGDL
eukprot:359869-Chlamydomonas_euryale.AAC.3